MAGGIADMLLGKKAPDGKAKTGLLITMDPDVEDGMMASFEEFTKAFKKGDNEAAMSSLWDFVKMCVEYGEKE